MIGSHARAVAGAACAVGLLVGGACTNTTSDGAAESLGPGDTTGVSTETIKIGWPVLDQSLLVEAGLAGDIGDTTEIAMEMVDDWNADGGVNGRKVELVERTFGSDLANVLPDMQRVCLELTEDQQVFAAVAVAWFGDAVTCVAGDHGTPLISQSSMADTVVESGNGNVFLANFAWEDALRSAVVVVDDAGDLDDFERIGVFGQLEPGMRQAIDDGLTPALEAAGSSLAADGTIPFSATLDSAAVAAVVSRFKAENVDAVFATGNVFVNGSFMTEAQRQGYRPTYVLSDLSEGTDDLILTFAPAEQLTNAIGASWKGKPPEPVPTPDDQACLDTYAPGARGSMTQEISATQTCQLMDLLRRGLDGAGSSPTREGFVAAMEDIGEFTGSGGGLASFGPDDHTMPDQVRLVRFDLAGCECWTAGGDWVDVDG